MTSASVPVIRPHRVEPIEAPRGLTTIEGTLEPHSPPGSSFSLSRIVTSDPLRGKWGGQRPPPSPLPPFLLLELFQETFVDSGALPEKALLLRALCALRSKTDHFRVGPRRGTIYANTTMLNELTLMNLHVLFPVGCMTPPATKSPHRRPCRGPHMAHS